MKKSIQFIHKLTNKVNDNITKHLISNIPFNLQNKVVFDNFLGKGYGENPKYIADEIIREGLPYRLIWLVKDMDEEMPKQVQKVRYGSIRALIELATARVWVDNVRNTMRPKKKNGQIYLQLWHGLYGDKPVERQAESSLNKKYIEKAKIDGALIDGIGCGNAFQKSYYQQDFWLAPNAEILEYGAPAFAALINNCEDIEKQLELKSRMGYEKDFLILYAPTFRDDNNLDAYNLNYNEILNAFENKMGQKCKIIIRFHPNASEAYSLIKYTDNILDGRIFKDYSILPMICDAVISDYSSVLYDFALSKKMAIIYAPDEQQYFAKRGSMKNYLHDPFYKTHDQNEMLHVIEYYDHEEYSERVDQFFCKYPLYDATDSAKKYVDWIKWKIEQKGVVKP